MRIRNEELGVRNWLVHTLLVVICFMASMTPAMAQQNSVCCTTSLKEEYFLEQLALNY